jgi:glycerophosphoryl diester phosphodiesterase
MSKQVAHAGHRVRALLGLLAFVACFVFMLIGRLALLVRSEPGRVPVPAAAIVGIVFGVGVQLATAGVLSVWQSLYFSRYDVYGRAPPNFFAFAYAAFPLRHLPTLARRLPRWLATHMTRRFVRVVHVGVVLAYALSVVIATILLGSVRANGRNGELPLLTIEHTAATAEGLFVLFHTLSLAWNVDFGLALLWNRHVGVAGGEGRRGVFGTALAQRQDLYIALATALQIVNSSQTLRIVSGICPYGEALNNGDAYIQSISDVSNFAFYCVFALSLIDCVVPRSLLVSVEDTFAFTLIDRRRLAPAVSVHSLDGNQAARAAANIFAQSRVASGLSAPHGGADDGATPSGKPTLLRRLSSRLGLVDDDSSDKDSALYVDWRRARPDVLVLREAGPSHDVPPFESVELTNAAARLGEFVKASIAVLLLIFRFTVLDRTFWQHLVVAVAFFLSLVSADSARTAALVMRPWVRLYRRRVGREPPSGDAEPRPWHDALTSACATLIFAALISLWIFLAAERSPIELGVSTFVTGAVFFVVQSLLVLLFAPDRTDRQQEATARVQNWIERLTTRPSVLASGVKALTSSSSKADSDDASHWHSAGTEQSSSSASDDEFETAGSGDDADVNDEQGVAASRQSRWRSTVVAALESPMSTNIAWRVRWLFRDLLIATMVAIGVLAAHTIFMQGLALALLVAVVWLVSGAVARSLLEARSDSKKLHGGATVVVLATRIVACVLLVTLVHAPFGSEPRLNGDAMPIIQGHRGVWSDRAAENSFAAVDLAVRARWHTVEVDIRQTKDDHLVVMHDVTLDRTVENATGNVEDFTLAELRAFSLADSDEGIHTLAEHLAYAKARNITVFIDLKPSFAASFAGPLRDFRRQQRTDAVIDVSAVMRALATACALGMLERTMLSSAELHYLVPVAAVAPEYTLERDFIWYSNDISLKVSPDRVFGISIEMLVFNPWLVRNAHRAGKQVVVFFLALESGPIIKYAIDMGADFLMLNTPEGASAAGLHPHTLLPRHLPNADAVATLCSARGRAWQSLPAMNATAGPKSRDTHSHSEAEWSKNWDLFNGSFPPTREDEGFCESLTQPFHACTPNVWIGEARAIWSQMGINETSPIWV